MTTYNIAALHDAPFWVFDLDNTLYPASCNLFPQIDKKMTSFIMDKFSCCYDDARAKQKKYFKHYGTTLSGLMQHDSIQPETFLDYVHDIDYTILSANENLQYLLLTLNKPLYIFTNGTKNHARNVLQQLCIDHKIFDAIRGIEDVHYVPKPHNNSFDSFFTSIERDVNAMQGGVMVEDIAKNLLVPHDYGMRTIWIKNDDDYGVDGAYDDHVHYHSDSVDSILAKLV